MDKTTKTMPINSLLLFILLFKENSHQLNFRQSYPTFIGMENLLSGSGMVLVYL